MAVVAKERDFTCHFLSDSCQIRVSIGKCVRLKMKISDRVRMDAEVEMPLATIRNHRTVDDLMAFIKDEYLPLHASNSEVVRTVRQAIEEAWWHVNGVAV